MSDTVGSIRHLAYHVYPHALNGGAIWRRCVSELRRRISLFNGRRIIGVATGPETNTLADVQAAFAGNGCEFIEVANNKDRREGTTLVPMYELLKGFIGPEDVTLHGHAKGISSEAWSRGSRRWHDACVESCLDYWPLIQGCLLQFPMVGPFKRQHSIFAVPGFKSRSQWHFSGAWRWFRNRDLFARDWRYVEPFWCGSETHPSMTFAAHEAWGLILEVPAAGQCLYEEPYWRSTAQPALEKFRTAYVDKKREPLLLTCILTSHNQPIRVHEAVASVLSQSADDWQLVIMDSGRSFADLACYSRDARVRVELTGETPAMREKLCMQSWAINQAFARGLVRGDLIVYLSDDDVFDPGCFAAYLAAARHAPERSAWHGRAEVWDCPAGRVATKVCDLKTWPVGTDLKCKIDGMQVCHRSSVGVAWPEAKEGYEHADGNFLRALSAKTPIHPLDILVGRHRRTPDSTFTRSS
jgi:hypothetical protein